MRAIAKFPEIACAVLLTVMIAAIFAQVVSRYVFRASLTWTEELGRMLFLWVVLLGGAVGVKRRTHFGVDFFISNSRGVVRRWMTRLMWSTSVVFSLVLVYGGMKLIQFTGDSRSSMPGWEQQYVYAIVPISGVLILVYLIYIARCHGFDVLPHRQGGPE